VSTITKRLTVDQYEAMVEGRELGELELGQDEPPDPPITVVHPPRGPKFLPMPACCEHLLCLGKPRGAMLRVDDGVRVGWVWFCPHHLGMPELEDRTP
jgi:hypothetical protein